MSEDQVAWNVVGMEWQDCAFIELKMICRVVNYFQENMSSIIIIIINFKSTVIINEFFTNIEL